MSQYAYCPECGTRIRLTSVRLGLRVLCEECGESSEIVSVQPIKLGWADDGLSDPEEQYGQDSYVPFEEYSHYEERSETEYNDNY